MKHVVEIKKYCSRAQQDYIQYYMSNIKTTNINEGWIYAIISLSKKRFCKTSNLQQVTR